MKNENSLYSVPFGGVLTFYKPYNPRHETPLHIKPVSCTVSGLKQLSQKNIKLEGDFTGGRDILLYIGDLW